jgi:3-oxoacyl-[acyl-carrier-protein] synthase II
MTARLPSIVVTGVGACTPLGASVESTWTAIRAGRSGITAVSLAGDAWPGFGAAAACYAVVQPPPLKQAKFGKYVSRAVSLALHALADASPADALAGCDPFRIAVHTATGHTGLDAEEFFPALSAAWADEPSCDYAHLGGRAARLVDPYFSLRTLANGALALIAGEVGARGPSTNYVQGEVAGGWALRAAIEDLRERRADVAIVLACDSLLQPSAWLAFEGQGLLSRADAEDALRPFDARRDGLVLGEGAAVLVLETRRRAQARHAAVLAVVHDVHVAQSGGALGTASAAGLELALEQARAGGSWTHLAHVSGREPSLILFARGLGTPAHDAEEADALMSAGLGGTVVTAVKGATGYLGAATGLVETAIAICSLRDGVAAPIVHLDRPDRAFRLPFAREVHALAPQARALVSCGGWSGEWAVVAISAPG